MPGKVLMSLEQAMNIAKAMWEVQGLTIPQIAGNMSKSVSAIEKWKVKKGWLKKTERGEELRELTRSKFLDQLAQAGMPSERVAKLMVEGMTTPMSGQVVAPDPNDSSKMIVVHDGFADHKTRHKYQHDYLVMAGVMSHQEKSQGSGFNGTVNVQVNIPTKD